LVRNRIFFENFTPPFPEKEVRDGNSNADETDVRNSIRAGWGAKSRSLPARIKHRLNLGTGKLE
jgi:hypothetical protein